MKKIVRLYSRCTSAEKQFLKKAVWVFLQELTKTYRGFSRWYAGLFVGNELKSDREIIVCVCDEKIAGVAITKNSTKEKKLCTLKVADGMRGTGLAYELVTLAVRTLEDDHPFCSVRIEKEDEFSRLFGFFGFAKEAENLQESFWNGV